MNIIGFDILWIILLDYHLFESKNKRNIEEIPFRSGLESMLVTTSLMDVNVFYIIRP